MNTIDHENRKIDLTDLGGEPGKLRELPSSDSMNVETPNGQGIETDNSVEKYLEENMVKVDTENKDSVFEVLKYPVTQEFYKLVYPDKTFSEENKKFPADGIRWIEAIKFCNAVSDKTGKEFCYEEKENPETGEKHWEVNKDANGYRLPDKEEWFFFARGGIKKESFKYSGSSQIENVAWYAGNSEEHLHEVGKKNENGVGLYDMSGNVKEFCWDTYKYGSDRIICGGAINSDKELCEINHDNYEHCADNVPYPYVGFRIIRCVQNR